MHCGGWLRMLRVPAMEQAALHPRSAARSAAELLNELRQPVLVGLSKTLRRSLASTIDDLLERLLKESSWEQRQAVDDALDLLRNGREGIELKFDRACAESWAEKTRPGGAYGPEATAGTRPSPSGRAAAGMPMTLTLVDDSAMGDQLIVGRIATRSRRRMDEEQVDGLRARFGALLGRDWFADNEHPVAPDLVFEALRKSLADFGQARVVLFLLEAFEPRISADLSALYAELNQRLIGLGVLPEIRYQISKTPVSKSGAGAGQSGQAPAPASVHDAQLAAPLQAPLGRPPDEADSFVARVQAAVSQTDARSFLMPPAAVSELVQQLDQRIHAAQGSATRYLSDPARFDSPQVPQALASDRLLAALTTLQVHPPPAGQDAATQVATAKAVSTAVAREHGSPLERLIIETVSLVFEHVYEDEAIADAVKQQLLRLQVAAFKAALIDPSFFARPNHPMRRLIDRIAEIGSDPDFENTAGSPLVADIAELVTWILANFDRDLATFEAALGRVDKLVAAECERRAGRLARIAAAAQKAETLEHARSKVREELSGALTHDTPEFICRFVAEPWTEVVSRLATGAEFAPFDASRARRTADQLLWSIAPKTPAEISALAAELPQLIADLSRGLSFIAQSGAERELFFSELLAWHGAAIDEAKRNGRGAGGPPPPVAAPGISPATASSTSPSASAFPSPPAPVVASAPASAGEAVAPRGPLFRRTSVSNEVAATRSRLGESRVGEPGPGDGESIAFNDAVQALGFTNGTEIELEASNGDLKRFKVGWMSPSRSVFIFSRYPRDHWTARRPLLNSLIAEGRIRFVGKVSETSAAIESLKSR